MTTTDRDLFRKDELFASIRRLFDIRTTGGATPKRLYRSVEQLNAALLADMRSHREPEWDLGDVVISANDRIFTRTHGGWYIAGNETFYGHEVPKRPLRALYKINGEDL